MRSLRSIASLASVLAVLSLPALVVGCGSDDEEVPPTPIEDSSVSESGGTDAATDTVMVVDSGMDTAVATDGGDAGAGDAGDVGMDGGDAGTLDFSDFVKGLINTQTTSSAVPTTVDDKTFTDRRDPADYNVLFP